MVVQAEVLADRITVPRRVSFLWDIYMCVCEKKRKRKGGRSKVKPVSCAAVALLLQSATDLKADY